MTIVDANLRVQALVEQGLTEVPKQFLHKVKEPLISDVSATEQVPVIDLAGWPNSNREKIIQEVGEVFETWGLFQIINHGVPLELLERTKESAKLFFAKPAEEKMKYANKLPREGETAVPEGYGSKLGTNETTSWNWRDFFEHHTFPLSRRNPLVWPAEPEFYRPTIEEYGGEIKQLAETLLSILSEHLKLHPTRLQEAIGVSGVYQNINFGCYPPCPQPDNVIGLLSHSDYGALTILWQNEVPGLQVRQNGTWVMVPPPAPGALIVNAGDTLEILSNGRYKSAEHRVVTNPHRTRISSAAFYDPAPEAVISPLPELVSHGNTTKYKPVVHGAYVGALYSTGLNGKEILENYKTDVEQPLEP
uniref:Leucoanthocyanidin dioxygenase n=1 Tax=Pohlia nutans TaxID=140635 RepID=A0A4P8JJR7_9BRYO|nr:leucoanthocyanidin dioxygenase [Pohlia nutans]